MARGVGISPRSGIRFRLRSARTQRWVRLVGWGAVGLLLFGPLGCNDEDDCVCCGPDLHPPAAPRGLYSITGNEQVTLVWLSNTESDLEGYQVLWSDSYYGEYGL